MIEDMLADIGCVVAGSVPDASGALALVGSQPVDAVILDIHLADGDSYGVADEMRLRGTPIIFATGDNRSEIPHPYDSHPCVTKPFSLSELTSELARAIDARAPG